MTLIFVIAFVIEFIVAYAMGRVSVKQDIWDKLRSKVHTVYSDKQIPYEVITVSDFWEAIN